MSFFFWFKCQKLVSSLERYFRVKNWSKIEKQKKLGKAEAKTIEELFLLKFSSFKFYTKEWKLFHKQYPIMYRYHHPITFKFLTLISSERKSKKFESGLLWWIHGILAHETDWIFQIFSTQNRFSDLQIFVSRTKLQIVLYTHTISDTNEQFLF